MLKPEQRQISFEELLFAPPEQPPEDLREAPPQIEAPALTPVAVKSPKAPEQELVPAARGGDESNPPGEKPSKTQEAKGKVDEAIKALADELEAGHSGALVQWLNVMGRFHNYSLNNTLLIAWQRPDATQVAGFRRWKEMGRTVRKGEKGIQILAPIPKGRKKDDATHEAEEGTQEAATGERGAVWGFRTGYVFDVSQTEGEALPEFAQVQGDPAEHLSKLKALVAAEGITLGYKKNLGGADGVSNKGDIQLLEGMTSAREFSVLVHELAHELLHKDPERRAQTSKTIRETEAEAVAFVVCRGIGLETARQHSDYIQLYRGSVATLTASLDAIRETSTQILRAVQ